MRAAARGTGEDLRPAERREGPTSHEQIAPPEKEERVAVYSDEEITITVPASYRIWSLVDNIGSDNMFVVTANLYYAPAYIASEDGCTPPLCGGWMLTVEWADSQYAASVYQDGETFYATCWRPDQQSVYMEQRPAAAELPADAPEEFLAVMESIEVDYGDLSPFAGDGGHSRIQRLNTAARKRFGGIPCPERDSPRRLPSAVSSRPIENPCGILLSPQ
ncbi:MAG: hypothetical protein V8R75_16505 [Oscillospiraceae bacterium]